MIHASWPVLHAPSFFEDLYKWSDPSCGMLVVAMCMLASRYSKDVRVYADASKLAPTCPRISGLVAFISHPADPSTAGRHFHPVFERLARYNEGDRLYEVLGYFFAAQFFCTDNVPEPQSAVYFGISFAKHVDMGLHR